MSVNIPQGPARPDLNHPTTYNARWLAMIAYFFDTLFPYLEGLSASEFFDTQLSATDTTAGRVLAINSTSGSFGLGATVFPSTMVDLDAANNPTGFWRTTGATVGTHPAGVSNFGVLRHERYDNANQAQWYVPVNADQVWTRRYKTDTWGDWRLVYDQASIVGTVSETGGAPTGAVIERGANANGEYTRWADGTQICTNDNAAITTAPAAFTGTITKIDGDKLWIGTWF